VKGRKTGGRTKGTPNRSTQDAVEKLERLNCDPIEGMARLAMDPANSPELRGRMLSELAQYCHAKRRSLDVQADVDSRTSVSVGNARALAALFRTEPEATIVDELDDEPAEPDWTYRPVEPPRPKPRPARRPPDLSAYTDGDSPLHEPDY